MTEAEQFDFISGKFERDRGLSKVEGNSGEFITLMREVARNLARRKGSVTSDDLRRYALQQGIEPHHPNAWGAIFKEKCWRSVNIVPSTLVSNHARYIRLWVLMGE